MDQARGNPRITRRPLLLGMAASLSASGVARGQSGTASDWPSRPVVYINVFPPGAATDILSRIYCDRMSQLAGQQFVVENRSGAGGTVGQAAIAQAPADGYTLGLGSIASLAIAPSILPDLPYDPARDFTFISGIWKVPNLLFVNNDLPARTVPELIDLLKKSPGKYTYGSSGFGTSPHLSMEMFKQKAGLEILHVPYRGGAPAMLDLLAGRVQLMFDNMPTVISAAREGKVRALAVTSAERSKAAPEIPTMTEFLPGFEITSWGSLVGPAGIPAPVVERLSSLTRQALENAELRRFFEENGATTWWTKPKELAQFRTAQEKLFAEVIRTAGAKVP
ncbi:Bug family tripartite tricarboxylate transporter substrate binding protein [Roseicella aerolata]|uniref:Tripartite tricarboxylate transporter substrate binding protein n=1 Tax=Roseicella aerolata TaxID=2883479 RepID=A0A9X1ICD3_9PROT|nr:tripartite tricarboxylate transporter substrate binding protein [Roseicella aerolata]MCB4822246.1 tripartite tricarboxylate transporter substrate binding protein [Roseicella aerolata]